MGIRTARQNPSLKHVREVDAVAGTNRLAEGSFGTDFRDAAITVRLRGDIDLRGARLQLLAQSKVRDRWVNYLLTSQPFQITSQWSEQTVVLHPDPSQWVCLGTRADRAAFYGWAPLEDVLADVNGNVVLALFPLTVVPRDEALQDDPHVLRAGADYAVREDLLPVGRIQYDWVKIDFSNHVCGE